MFTEFRKKSGKPTVVCIPGLLGGPEDFQGILAGIEDQFSILFIDPNRARKEKGGLAQLTLEETVAISYDSTAEAVYTALQEYQVECAYFIGLSIGGKVVYDFAIRYPAKFLGAVISDVGPTSCIGSDLYRTVDQVVGKTDLNLSWDELKKSLKDNIPDRSLRSLIQSQISYPNGKPPAIWKTGMRGLRKLLMSNSIDEQSEAFGKANQDLLRHNKKITLVHSSHLSGITPDGLERIKREWHSVTLQPIENSGHFLHITHKEELKKAFLALL